MRAGDGELRVAHPAGDGEEGQGVVILRGLDGAARVQGEELREPRRRAGFLRALRAVEESLRRALREIRADEVLVLVEQRRDGSAHDVAQLEIREVDLVGAGDGHGGRGGSLAIRAGGGEIGEGGGLGAGEQLFLGKDGALGPGVRADECGHRLHHGAFLFHDLLAGDGEHAPVAALLEQDGAAFAGEQVAPVVRREPGDFQRVERAGEVIGEFQDVLEPVVFDHEIPQPLGLEVLLDVRGEAGEEAGEFLEILLRDVGLEPDLEDAEHLLFQEERDVEEGIGRLVQALPLRGLALELGELGIERAGVGLRLGRGAGQHERLLRLHDFVEGLEDDGSHELVRLEKRGLELDLRRELELALSLRRLRPDEPDRAALAIARLHHADEELREVVLAPQVLLAELRDFIHEALNSDARRFDRLFLGHERGESRRDGGNCKARGRWAAFGEGRLRFGKARSAAV